MEKTYYIGCGCVLLFTNIQFSFKHVVSGVRLRQSFVVTGILLCAKIPISP